MVRMFLGMRRRAMLATMLAAALVATIGQAARAEPPSAEAVVQDLAGQIWAILERRDLDERGRQDELAGTLASATDVDLLGRLVLGRYWRLMSDEQRSGYQELFGDVVMHNLAARLERYARDATGAVEDHFRIVGGSRVGKRDVLVRSQVIPAGGRPVMVEWRLREGPDHPLIIDLVIEGVSLLVSQRSEFAAVIERSDMDGLLAELRARAESLRS